MKPLPDNKLDGGYYCSVCSNFVDLAAGNITPLDIGMYFCSNCGADMREETDG